MRACHVPALACLLLAMPANAVAQDADSDVPAFDRPGLGLGTGIVPRAAAALELGLPSYARDKDRDGIRSEQSSGDATVRTGLAPQLELQLSGSLWQQQRTRAPGQSSQRMHGHSDTLVALKMRPSMWGWMQTARIYRRALAWPPSSTDHRLTAWRIICTSGKR